jgi:hypothetical protein
VIRFVIERVPTDDDYASPAWYGVARLQEVADQFEVVAGGIDAGSCPWAGVTWRHVWDEADEDS